MSPLLRIILGAAVGAAIGFGMYKFIGCRTGTCPLTANPYIAMILWAIIGATFASGK